MEFLKTVEEALGNLKDVVEVAVGVVVDVVADIVVDVVVEKCIDVDG